MQVVIIKRDISRLYKKIYSEMTQLLDGLEMSDWRVHTVGTRWTVGELLTHLSQHPQDLAIRLNTMQKGQSVAWIPQRLIDLTNYYRVKRAAHHTDINKIKHNLNRNFQECLRLMEGVPDEAWNTSFRTPYGTFTAKTTFTAFENEWRVHSKQIRDGLAKRPSKPTKTSRGKH